MLTLDKTTGTAATEDTRTRSASRQADGGRPALTTRERRFIASLAMPRALAARIDEPAIDPALRPWIPRVVPMLAVLICGCILAIWSLL